MVLGVASSIDPRSLDRHFMDQLNSKILLYRYSFTSGQYFYHAARCRRRRILCPISNLWPSLTKHPAQQLYKNKHTS